MRILHTSDWHLGRTLEGRSRLPEQEAFLEEFCRIAEDEKIDLVLIAGDIYDTANPPAAAEELFYDALDRLAAGGKRGVAVIAGNHDNPERLRASGPLAGRQGIALLGLPADAPYLHNSPGKVGVVAGGPSWLEITVPGCGHSAVLLALPYPSEARLRELLAQSPDETLLQQAYSARVGGIFAGLAQNFRSDTVNLAMSHLFVLGGLESEGSERPINLGGACTVDPAMLPGAAHYTALGHLHRPQRVGGTADRARYSGSPLAYGFGEAGQAKSVIIVEASPGKPAEQREILLSSGCPLVKWRSAGGLAEVFGWIEEDRDSRAWIDLEVHLNQPLTNEEIQRLRTLRPQLLNIRPVLPGMDEELVREKRAHLSIDELFRRFYHHQTGGAQPAPELVELFLELLDSSESAGDPEKETEPLEMGVMK